MPIESAEYKNINNGLSIVTTENNKIVIDYELAGELYEEATQNKEKVVSTEPPSTQSSTSVDNTSKPVLNSLPNKSSVSTMTYAGIGSRQTPQEVLDKMTEVAKYLDNLGYTLQTGFTFKNKETNLDEEGADKAFSDGSKNKILFGPYGIRKTVKGIVSADTYNEAVTEKSSAIVKEVHPAPDRLSPGAIKLMARNTNQIFGKDLSSTVDFVLFYAKETSNPLRPAGGTGQAVEMARRKGIPTINMADTNWRDQLKTALANKPTQSSTSDNYDKAVQEANTRKPIAQNFFDGYRPNADTSKVHTIRPEIVSKYKKRVNTITLVKDGIRTRSTRLANWMKENNPKIGDYFWQINEKNPNDKVLTKITAVYGNSDPRFKDNWFKEGWIDSNFEYVKSYDSAIEFEVVTPSQQVTSTEPTVKEESIISKEDVASYNLYKSKANGKPIKEFFTSKTKFKEFYNSQTGKREGAPQTSIWELQSDGLYNLVDTITGEVYITDVDLSTGKRKIIPIIKLQEIDVANQLKLNNLKSLEQFITFTILREKAKSYLFKSDTETDVDYEKRLAQEAINDMGVNKGNLIPIQSLINIKRINFNHGTVTQGQFKKGYLRPEIYNAKTITNVWSGVTNGLITQISIPQSSLTKLANSQIGDYIFVDNTFITRHKGKRLVLKLKSVSKKSVKELLAENPAYAEDWSKKEGWTAAYLEGNNQVLNEYPVTFEYIGVQNENGTWQQVSDKYVADSIKENKQVTITKTETVSTQLGIRKAVAVNLHPELTNDEVTETMKYCSIFG
jgi:hypothetical protein